MPGKPLLCSCPSPWQEKARHGVSSSETVFGHVCVNIISTFRWTICNADSLNLVLLKNLLKTLMPLLVHMYLNYAFSSRRVV